MAAVPVGNICDKNTFFNFLSLSLSLFYFGDLLVVVSRFDSSQVCILLRLFVVSFRTVLC